MKYCNRCVMPDTRPGIRFHGNTCSACENHEQRQKWTDWDKRWRELEAVCDKYRGSNGDDYDCIITVSGGKDSHFQVYTLKERLYMNPLLVSIDNISWTKTGRMNKENISDAFGCDIITLSLNRRAARKIMRRAFEELGSPTIAWDKAVYAFPLQMGIKLGIPLIWYGENVSATYGGPNAEDVPSALNQIHNAAVAPVPDSFWLDAGVSTKEIRPFIYPTAEEIEGAKLDPQYLSYYVPWSGYANKELARSRGFKTLDDTGEWDREGFVENYDQIDSAGYLVHPWLKYPKYGHARITDVCSNWIREGRMTREEAIELVREHDHKLDPVALADFLEFTGYTEEEFREIVDRFYNRELFEKVDGEWKLKTPIWEESSS